MKEETKKEEIKEGKSKKEKPKKPKNNKELEKLKEENALLSDKCLRVQAELANVIRRTGEEKEKLYRFCIYSLNFLARNVLNIVEGEKIKYSRTILAKAIFETLSQEKPLIHKLRNKEESLEWDEHFNRPFEEMDDKMRDDLVGLLDGDFVYELPEEYYNY